MDERYTVIKGAVCQMVPTTSLGETGIWMSGEFPHTPERLVMLEPLRMALRQRVPGKKGLILVVGVNAPAKPRWDRCGNQTPAGLEQMRGSSMGTMSVTDDLKAQNPF